MKNIAKIVVSILIFAGTPQIWAEEREEIPSSIKAYELYEAAEYEQAVKLLKQITREQPDNSEMYHLLGKCYGRLAEKSVFLEAMKFAKKTVSSFEKAVALDETNIDAIKDLISYYEKAPGFLGGSRKKAAHWQTKLEHLRDSNQINNPDGNSQI